MKNAAAQFVGEPTQTFAAEPVSEAHNCIRAIVGAFATFDLATRAFGQPFGGSLAHDRFDLTLTGRR